MSCIPLVSLVNTGNLHVLQAGEPGQQLSSRCLSVTVLKLLAQQLPAAHGFPGGSGGKESACNVGDPGMIRGWGRSPEEGKGQPTLVFLPGESCGQKSLAGYSPGVRSQGYSASTIS